MSSRASKGGTQYTVTAKPSSVLYIWRSELSKKKLDETITKVNTALEKRKKQLKSDTKIKSDARAEFLDAILGDLMDLKKATANKISISDAIKFRKSKLDFLGVQEDVEIEEKKEEIEKLLKQMDQIRENYYKKRNNDYLMLSNLLAEGKEENI